MMLHERFHHSYFCYLSIINEMHYCTALSPKLCDAVRWLQTMALLMEVYVID